MALFTQKKGDIRKSCPSHSLRKKQGNFYPLSEQQGNQQGNVKATLYTNKATIGQPEDNKKLPSPPPEVAPQGNRKLPPVYGIDAHKKRTNYGRY